MQSGQGPPVQPRPGFSSLPVAGLHAGVVPTVISLVTGLTARVLAERYVAAHRDLPPGFVADAEALATEMLQISIRRGEPFVTLFLRTNPPGIGVQARDAVSRYGGPGPAQWVALRPAPRRAPGTRRPSSRPARPDPAEVPADDAGDAGAPSG